MELVPGSQFGAYRILGLIGKGGMYGNVARITPPLNISKSDVDEFARLLDRSLTAATQPATASA